MTTLRAAAERLIEVGGSHDVMNNTVALRLDEWEAFREALDAEPPGLEEVRAKLERLYSEGFDDGMRWGGVEHFESEIDPERRDPLIAGLLAMFQPETGIPVTRHDQGEVRARLLELWEHGFAQDELPDKSRTGIAERDAMIAELLAMLEGAVPRRLAVTREDLAAAMAGQTWRFYEPKRPRSDAEHWARVSESGKQRWLDCADAALAMWEGR